MVQIVRLRTRKDVAYQADLFDLAEQLRAWPEAVVAQLPGEARLAFSRLVYGLHREARSASERLWAGGFVMLSRDQTELVWEMIGELPPGDRPHLVKDAFMMMMLNIRQDTGEVMLTREELAAKLRVRPDRVSTVMSTLERMGVVRRDLTRIEGLRGRGVVTYIVNANVGWNGSLDIRKVEASKLEKPSLTLVKGGRSAGRRSTPPAT